MDKAKLRKYLSAARRPPMWRDVKFEVSVGIFFVLIGWLFKFVPAYYTAGFLFIQAFLDTWYILRPPKGEGLKQYAKDVFGGKIDPDK